MNETVNNILGITAAGFSAYILLAIGIFILNLLIKWLILSSAINRGIQDAVEAILQKYEFVNDYEVIKESGAEYLKRK